jgi:predicted amidohydrolase
MSPDVLINTAPFIDNTGTILDTYTKTNLWHPERPVLTASAHHAPNESPHTVITTPFGLIGILVCWDLAFPEAFRALIRLGAKVIVIPSFWTNYDMSTAGREHNPKAEEIFVQASLVTRAFENTATIVFVNATGSEDDGFFGLSQVVVPIVGTVEGSLMGREQGMRVVDVPLEVGEIAERNYKIREDLAREDWHYGYAKLGELGG